MKDYLMNLNYILGLFRRDYSGFVTMVCDIIVQPNRCIQTVYNVMQLYTSMCN